MKSTFLTAAAIGLAPLGLVLSGPAAWAQTGDEPAAQTEAQAGAETAAEQPAKQEAGGYSIASELAQVDGATLTLGDLITIRRQLPQQLQNIPDPVLMKALTEQMIDGRGRAQGADAGPALGGAEAGGPGAGDHG